VSQNDDSKKSTHGATPSGATPAGGRRFNYHEAADPDWQKKIALAIKTAAVASVAPPAKTAPPPPIPAMPEALVKTLSADLGALSKLDGAQNDSKIKRLALVPQKEEKLGDIPLDKLVWIAIYISSAALFFSLLALLK